MSSIRALYVCVQHVPVMRPDGDVELQDAGVGFQVPACAACGGTLKPHVVFFGDSIPKERAQRSLELARAADLVLVVGSSLTVGGAQHLLHACTFGLRMQWPVVHRVVVVVT